ncbi:MAG: hypothetical protein ACD_72C00297G0009, partial [uncultured bacterium]
MNITIYHKNMRRPPSEAERAAIAAG